MTFVVAPIDELRGLLTRSFETWSRERADGRLSCALSGGATALLFLGALRIAHVDWSRITLFWTDERGVSTADPDSNYGVAERLLLAPLGAKGPRALRMQGEHPSLDEAALQYDQTIAHELQDGPLDLALMGFGEDGHICSLFPGHRALADDDLRVVAIEDAPKMPTRRLSLTLPFLRQTRQIWLVAVGPRKLPALRAAMSRTQRLTPLDLLFHYTRDITVFTDQAIAMNGQ